MIEVASETLDAFEVDGVAVVATEGICENPAILTGKVLVLFGDDTAAGIRMVLEDVCCNDEGDLLLPLPEPIPSPFCNNF